MTQVKSSTAAGLLDKVEFINRKTAMPIPGKSSDVLTWDDGCLQDLEDRLYGIIRANAIEPLDRELIVSYLVAHPPSYPHKEGLPQLLTAVAHKILREHKAEREYFFQNGYLEPIYWIGNAHLQTIGSKPVIGPPDRYLDIYSPEGLSENLMGIARLLGRESGKESIERLRWAHREYSNACYLRNRITSDKDLAFAYASISGSCATIERLRESHKGSLGHEEALRFRNTDWKKQELVAASMVLYHLSRAIENGITPPVFAMLASLASERIAKQVQYITENLKTP